MTSQFVPTREAALSRLSAFLPAAGAAYAETRNYDFGPDNRSNISALSPYIRHRLITEREVCAAVLEQHGLQASQKFIQEVLWRTYWKGWLELRPSVWTRYKTGLDQAIALLDRNGGVIRDYRAAVEGRTGIDGFDDWARELTETGYLHNHARMWFASIWIFTLRLPWELGADFFFRHLLDGDAASNTLSWRWVAGLQTKGKTYAATRDNIKQFTAGRYSPVKALAREAIALEEPQIRMPQALQPMPAAYSGEAALLLTEDDYGIETLDIDWKRISAVQVADFSGARSDRGAADPVISFGRAAAKDTIQRLQSCARQAAIEPDPVSSLLAEAVLSWLEKAGVKTLVIPETPVGPAADAIHTLAVALNPMGITIIRIRRHWDSFAWPHAQKGFFAFKDKIPDLLKAELLI